MSERQRVIRYLNKRINDAWIAHKDYEARQCLDFLESLESMSDEEYQIKYKVEVYDSI